MAEEPAPSPEHHDHPNHPGLTEGATAHELPRPQLLSYCNKKMAELLTKDPYDLTPAEARFMQAHLEVSIAQTRLMETAELLRRHRKEPHEPSPT